MSKTLKHVNNFYLETLGPLLAGHQGLPGDGSIETDPVSLTVNGQGDVKQFSLNTATALKIFDAAVDTPASFSFIHLVCDQILYLQVITASTNFIIPINAGIPFTLSSFSMLAAANTTPMSGAAPAVVNIAKIYVQNNSGTTANGSFFFVV